MTGRTRLLTTEAVTQLEEDLARVFGVPHAVAVASGTAALHCAFAALDLGPGDEVLVPTLAVVMSIAPVLYTGATPVFVDCGVDRVGFDFDDLARSLTSRTKAVLAVHLWGYACEMERLVAFAAANRLAVVEDACQAHGSELSGRLLGTWGDVGCFSLRDGKVLSCGEGGFLLTGNEQIAERCRAMRTHWFDIVPARSYARLGWNYRLSNPQAVVAREEVGHFQGLLDARRTQSAHVHEQAVRLAGVKPYVPARGERPNGYSPVLLFDEVDAARGVAEELAQRGIANSVATFGLRPVHEWGAVKPCVARPVKDVNCRHLLARAIAPLLRPDSRQSELDAIVTAIAATQTNTQANDPTP